MTDDDEMLMLISSFSLIRRPYSSIVKSFEIYQKVQNYNSFHQTKV